jgi:hypothetical protein
MSDSNSEGLGNAVKQIFKKLTGTLGFVLCAVGILGFLISGFAIDYIDERLEEDCEGVKGTLIQTSGVDEGQCDEGSATRDLLVVIQYPLLIAGIVCGLIGAKVF